MSRHPLRPDSDESPNSSEYLYVAVELLGWSEAQYRDCGPREFHAQVQAYLQQHPEDQLTAQWLKKCQEKFEKLAALLEPLDPK